MRFKSRLKRACLNFLRELFPTHALASYYHVPLPVQEAEPALVLDNSLLTEKNVLITGAGRNIGKGIALEMAKQGANIYFTDIDQERCNNLEQELSNYTVKSKGFLSNVAKIEDVDSLCDSLIQEGVNIDILVNNAGIQFETPTIKNLDLREWDKVFDTNLFGPIYLTNRVTQMMVSNHISGSIIFITSTHQWIVRRDPAYSASKSALGMIIKELAIDLAPHRIRVNGIAPGFVLEDEQGNPLSYRYAALYNSTINPRYIGRTAVYLASNYFSKFTTGTVVKVDAGLSLYDYCVDHTPPQ